jgi:hypothetical protein
MRKDTLEFMNAGEGITDTFMEIKDLTPEKIKVSENKSDRFAVPQQFVTKGEYLLIAFSFIVLIMLGLSILFFGL